MGKRSASGMILIYQNKLKLRLTSFARTILLLVLALCILPPDLMASCALSPCYLIEFDVAACEFKKVVAKLPSYAGAFVAETEDEVLGVELTPENVALSPTACFEGSEVSASELSAEEKYFYETADSDFCEKNSGARLKKFFRSLCCDTLPQPAICQAGPVLIDLPGFVPDSPYRKLSSMHVLLSRHAWAFSSFSKYRAYVL